MKVHFVHQNPGRHSEFKSATFAFILPSKTDLEAMLKAHANATLIQLGVANVNPKDHFVKKKGRELAESRINLVKVNLEDIGVVGTKLCYHFVAELPSKCPNETTQIINFGLGTVAENSTTKLLYAYVN